MTEKTFADAAVSSENNKAVWGVLLLALVVCFFAVSRNSFWIDECGVAYKASLPTFKAFWTKISTEGTADLQQPFHHFLTWGWEKVFGIGEFAFRSANIPFLLLGVVSVFYGFAGSPRVRRGFMAALLTSAFVWYYLNEARPYTVQIGASLLVFSSIYRLSTFTGSNASETRWVVALCGGMVLLAASGMLAMLWLGGYLLGALLSTPWSRLIRLLREHWLAWSVTTLLLLGIGLFYLWTLSIGARATAVGRTDLRNLVFIVYELLGFSGVGPGRLAIRDEGLRAFLPWIPWLALYGIFTAAVIAAGLRAILSGLTKRQRWSWPLSLLAIAFFIFAVGMAVHFRVLGRHCTPLLPLILYVVGAGLAALWDNGRKLARLAGAGFLVMALASCLTVRLAGRHAKDDYRAAARYASTFLKSGETVWWSADAEGGRIYGLPVRTNLQADAALYVGNHEPGFLSGLPTPKLVMTSKPDVYDGYGALQEYLEANGFKPVTNFVAFTAWRQGR